MIKIQRADLYSLIEPGRKVLVVAPRFEVARRWGADFAKALPEVAVDQIRTVGGVFQVLFNNGAVFEFVSASSFWFFVEGASLDYIVSDHELSPKEHFSAMSALLPRNGVLLELEEEFVPMDVVS